MLSPERLNRFARHIVLPEVGGAGQVALGQAHVVLIGCGGIGSPALQYLAAAGVGTLTLIDDDTVEASNLQRQTIFATLDIGRPKAEAAAAWVASKTPPKQTAGPTWAPQSLNLFGSKNYDENLASLHRDPQGFMDQQLTEFVSDPDKYVADTFGRVA